MQQDPTFAIFSIIFGVFLAFLIGKLGKKRSIGFWGAFLLSLFLSPIIGLIVTLCCSRTDKIHFDDIEKQ